MPDFGVECCKPSLKIKGNLKYNYELGFYDEHKSYHRGYNILCSLNKANGSCPPHEDCQYKEDTLIKVLREWVIDTIISEKKEYREWGIPLDYARENGGVLKGLELVQDKMVELGLIIEE